MIKISDKVCNLRSILTDPPQEWSLKRRRGYFLWAKQVVDGLLGVNQALDECVQSILEEGLRTLSPAEPGRGGSA
jgi:guanosine-3',5'-bis(diphosphate) 3'-pyrophosphohydrolase